VDILHHDHRDQPMTITDLATHPAHFISIPELADYLGVSRRSLYHQIDKGALAAVRMGGVLRMRTSEVRRYCQAEPARIFDDEPATIRVARASQSPSVQSPLSSRR
jgi:excisionase family DNA binding protein